MSEGSFPDRKKWALSLANSSRRKALSSALLLRQTLIVGEPNTGKTALLNEIRKEANLDATHPRAVLVDAKPAGDVRELVDLVLDTAVAASWIPSAGVPDPDDTFGPVFQIERLIEVPRPSLILIDDITHEQAVILFGRFRDLLFQVPQVTFTVTTSPAVGQALAHPPMDAFFDTVVTLDRDQHMPGRVPA